MHWKSMSGFCAALANFAIVFPNSSIVHAEPTMLRQFQSQLYCGKVFALPNAGIRLKIGGTWPLVWQEGQPKQLAFVF
jgi:hypothetical protein